MVNRTNRAVTITMTPSQSHCLLFVSSREEQGDGVIFRAAANKIGATGVAALQRPGHSGGA
jgi:hypothetical protein